MRFGDLDGDGRLDMLFAQQVAKVRGDAFDQISCLTAVTLEGKVLWQQGRPNPKNDLLTNDTPFQIHDLDGDGRTEVVLARDFQLQVLDGRTGRLLRREWLPQMPPEMKDRPYELNIGDSLLFVDLGGAGRAARNPAQGSLRHFWIFDRDLKPVFEGRGQTGHYPFPIDINGDGRQEILIGYSLWELAARRWTHDTALKDHADALSIGSFGPRQRRPMRAYVDGSDEGFLIFDLDGSLLKHLRLGHAQTQSVGRYRPDLHGLQIAIANFWRNPGIVTILDHDGNILAQDEMIPASRTAAGPSGSRSTRRTGRTPWTRDRSRRTPSPVASRSPSGGFGSTRPRPRSWTRTCSRSRDCSRPASSWAGSSTSTTRAAPG